MSSTKAPKRQPSLCTALSPKIWPQRPTPEPGIPSWTEFPPSSSNRQKSGMLDAPGNRHAIPMMAIGSVRRPFRSAMVYGPLAGRLPPTGHLFRRDVI